MPTQSPEVACRTIDGEAVIVVPAEGLVRVLNKVGTDIWELCDGTRRIEEIIAFLTDKYKITEEEARRETMAFLEELEKKQMLLF